MKPNIWEPVAEDKEITFKMVEIPGLSRRGTVKIIPKIQELIQLIDGEIVYASKPLLTTLGVGLITKFTQGKKLLVDLDDWQMGFRKEKLQTFTPDQKRQHLIKEAFKFYESYSYWNNFLGEKLTNSSHQITVSNRFLQEKFGGQVVRHAVDTDLFNSDKYNPEQFRQELGIDPSCKILMFCGTPQVHKGIDDLIDAANLLTDRDDFLLAVVGNQDSGYAKTVTDRAQETLGKKFRAFGLQPFEKIPQFLSLADVIVIPQRKNFSTVGQVPIKVFEGMGMAKPVISTAVSDIPEILQGCGWIVEPENPVHLAEAIRAVLADPAAAQAMGQKARQNCVENYSWDAVEQVLQGVIQSTLATS